MKQETIKAILIDAEKRVIYEVDIDKNDITDIQQAIGCDCFTTAGRLPNGDVMFVDDEALIKTPRPDYGFVWMSRDYPILGRGLLMGGTLSGDSADVKTNMLEIAGDIEWMDVPAPARA